MTASPYIANNPLIAIDDAPDEFELQCSATKIALTVEQDEVDLSSFCSPNGTGYGPEQWTLSIDARQSFGPPGADIGLWQALRSRMGKEVSFRLLLDKTQPVGPDNVQVTGKVRIPATNFLDAGVGETTDLSIDMPVSGIPVFAEA